MTAQDAANNAGPSQFKRNSLPLNTAVMVWPTPAAMDANPITGGNLYKTKTGTVRHMRPDGKSSNRGLAAAVQMWPTPNAQTQAGGTTGLNGGSGARRRVHQMVGRDEALRMTGGKLNPDWVEWLMGWPIGWTDLAPLDGVALASWHREPDGVPRTTDRTENRVSRLKALGNGQVPACAAAAWRLLTDTL